MDVDGVEVQGQYGCINFHVKHGSQRAKLTVAVKNKWARAWMHAWFYCKVPLIRSPSPERGKGVWALHTYMTELNFMTDPPFDYPDDEVNDAAFIKATRTISGRNAVEEYMAYGLFRYQQASGWVKLSTGRHMCQSYQPLWQIFLSPDFQKGQTIDFV
jgi:hypothetical protein